MFETSRFDLAQAVVVIDQKNPATLGSRLHRSGGRFVLVCWECLTSQYGSQHCGELLQSHWFGHCRKESAAILPELIALQIVA